MKQKLFLLMVLVAGLVACSKDEDEKNVYQRGLANNHMNYLGIGEFEGDWIFNNVKVGTDTIKVLPELIYVNVPEDILLRYVATEYVKSLIFNSEQSNDGINAAAQINDGLFSDLKVQSSNPRYWFYESQGYSDNTAYFNYNLPEIPEVRFVTGLIEYKGGNVNKTWYLSFSTDKPIVAVYNKDTNLWTLKITLNKIIDYKDDGDKNTMDLQSPAELLFVATKKLGNTATD